MTRRIGIVLLGVLVIGCASSAPRSQHVPPNISTKPPKSSNVDHAGFENTINSARKKLEESRTLAEKIDALLEAL